jgi:hypothetical protein
MITKFLSTTFKRKGKTETKNFFDYSSKEKKQIIEAAAKGTNTLQRALIDKYNLISR